MLALEGWAQLSCWKFTRTGDTGASRIRGPAMAWTDRGFREEVSGDRPTGDKLWRWPGSREAEPGEVEVGGGEVLTAAMFAVAVS